MEANLEQIREQQKESWNKFSAGWKKWDDFMMNSIRPMGEQIIHFIKPKEGETILDIAAGTGEPGLTIAKMIGKGEVISTDLSEDMLKVAQEKATSKGILNFETRVCDVSQMPFADNTFDAAGCRFGFMFFPDMLLAAKEILRVLKPSGRFATAFWNGPEKNFWVTAISSVINKNMQLPQPPPGAPGMFRCAGKGFMKNIFEAAGFKNISEVEVEGAFSNYKTVNFYWDVMTEVAAPFVAALSKADDVMKAKIKTEVFDLVNQKYPDGNVNMSSSAIVIYGEK